MEREFMFSNEYSEQAKEKIQFWKWNQIVKFGLSEMY